MSELQGWLTIVSVIVGFLLILWRGGRWTATLDAQLKHLCTRMGYLHDRVENLDQENQKAHRSLGEKLHSHGEKIAVLSTRLNQKP